MAAISVREVWGACIDAHDADCNGVARAVAGERRLPLQEVSISSRAEMVGSLIRTVFGALCLVLGIVQPLHAQGLRVIAVDPVQGPICAGPLGPGPCARVQQYIMTHPMAGQPSGPSQVPATIPGTRPPPQTNGTTQQIAINCARRSGTDVRAFVACAQGNVILPQREQAVLDCAVSSRTEWEFAECAAPNLGIRLSDDQRTMADCAMQSGGDSQEFVSCAGSGLIGSRLTADQKFSTAPPTQTAMFLILHPVLHPESLGRD